jgi:GTP-binding protein
LTHWKSETVCTAWKASDLPHPESPEVVIVGRSNVGKSTLINSLLNRLGKKVAYVSSKPGKTRSVNFYKIFAPSGAGEDVFFLVDMPGYGYASRGRDERAHWWKLVNDYFSGNRDTAFVIHLVDFRHGFLPGDEQLTAWLDGLDMPRLVVFTKGDKLPRGRSKILYGQYVAKGIVSILPPVVTCGKNDEAADYLRIQIPRIIHELQNA